MSPSAARRHVQWSRSLCYIPTRTYPVALKRYPPECGQGRCEANMLLSLCIVCYGLLSAVAVRGTGLKVELATAPGLMESTLESGRLLVLFGRSRDDLSNTDVRTTDVQFFGMNVYNLSGQAVTLTGGSDPNLDTGVFGWPLLTLDDIPTGTYYVQGFLSVYNESVTRSDGSTVTMRFPCGDGNRAFDGAGSLSTSILEVEVWGGAQTITLQLQAIKPPVVADGTEIGGCSQGNYKDTDLLRYVKIRSDSLSNFWNRDMYVGATVFLPFGYNATDEETRYPVLFSQFHWLGGAGWWSHDADFTSAWYRGMIPARGGVPERPTPRLIVIMFRHENPFYDDSYAVNTPNIGPYGDALNDELLPYLDEMFNTIPKPYARIQEGGSTGGWAAAASVVFRPDLYGACFAAYPDSLDFHRHQDINLYEDLNAHVRYSQPIPSNRKIGSNGVPYTRVTMAQENHWELTFGTSGRSAQQTDVWFAVFGVQGLNGYPLAAWDKVTGEIYHDAIKFWQPMDLTHYIVSNWKGQRNLGEVLRGRLFIYVGGSDSYYLNEGVQQFHMRTAEKGGLDWANVTILQGEEHGGVYNLLPKWTYLDTILSWVADHGPDGGTPLLAEHTTTASRGNVWQDVLSFGGHQAALARQSPPRVQVDRNGILEPRASAGQWDPGVTLRVQWIVDGMSSEATAFIVKQGHEITYVGGGTWKTLQLSVTGTKRDYATETRLSNIVTSI
ncbi:hypothetical protein DOTSEDRAFT_74814 [Dothistroma septosporum NZE10]|uniref:Uncharacterized protein n=1 Tax=Dothistroma septosporum (strain NZE10 / CBS 128990) TaxID=675120 RepID=N1PCA5_DOTSN|nr:hypothetical protein DOTSEDRAFT_74814 [Dothistroma septosporum NZE10]